MDMLSRTTKILIFVILNLLLLILLYNIPRDFELLNNICLIKFVLKRPCWNCGMTRAFLPILHLDFETAYRLNHNVVIVFPLTVWMYLYSWYKFIFKEEVFENDRKG